MLLSLVRTSESPAWSVVGQGGTETLPADVFASAGWVLVPACCQGQSLLWTLLGWAKQNKTWARTPERGTPGSAIGQPGAISESFGDSGHSGL